MEIASFSLKHFSKNHCGDSLGHRLLHDGQLALLCVADGVGSAAYDWKASRICCDTLLGAFEESSQAGPDEQLAEAVAAANEAVMARSHGGAAMLTTLVAAAWHLPSRSVFTVSIGDSRIYAIGLRGVRRLSADESRAVIVRGPDGKPRMSSGTLMVRTGITNAIGIPHVDVAVETHSTDKIHSLLLATDGYYSSPAFNESDLVTLTDKADLAGALAVREALVRDVQSDDATALLARDETLADEQGAKALRARARQ